MKTPRFLLPFAVLLLTLPCTLLPALRQPPAELSLDLHATYQDFEQACRDEQSFVGPIETMLGTLNERHEGQATHPYTPSAVAHYIACSLLNPTLLSAAHQLHKASQAYHEFLRLFATTRQGNLTGSIPAMTPEEQRTYCTTLVAIAEEANTVSSWRSNAERLGIQLTPAGGTPASGAAAATPVEPMRIITQKPHRKKSHRPPTRLATLYEAPEPTAKKRPRKEQSAPAMLPRAHEAASIAHSSQIQPPAEEQPEPSADALSPEEEFALAGLQALRHETQPQNAQPANQENALGSLQFALCMVQALHPSLAPISFPVIPQIIPPAFRMPDLAPMPRTAPDLSTSASAAQASTQQPLYPPALPAPAQTYANGGAANGTSSRKPPRPILVLGHRPGEQPRFISAGARTSAGNEPTATRTDGPNGGAQERPTKRPTTTAPGESPMPMAPPHALPTGLRPFAGQFPLTDGETTSYAGSAFSRIN